jgi:hypothetical protein
MTEGALGCRLHDVKFQNGYHARDYSERHCGVVKGKPVSGWYEIRLGVIIGLVMSLLIGGFMFWDIYFPAAPKPAIGEYWSVKYRVVDGDGKVVYSVEHRTVH